MRKDIDYLVKRIFDKKELLIQIGFTLEESEIFHKLIHGDSIFEVSQKMNLPYEKIRKIKNKRFHLIPYLFQKKFDQIDKVDISSFYSELLKLNTCINNYLSKFDNQIVYTIYELNLSKRTINSLTAANIKSTLDLLNFSKKELTNIKNLGEKSILEIEYSLSQLNLKLND